LLILAGIKLVIYTLYTIFILGYQYVGEGPRRNEKEWKFEKYHKYHGENPTY